MIPAAIQALLPQHPGEENRIGHSGAQVVMYEDCVLKVQPDTGNAANEGIMLRFLKGRLPVPEVLAEAVQGGMRYLLMTRLRGRMLCDEAFLDNQPLLARRMADAGGDALECRHCGLSLLLCAGRRPAKGGSRHRRWARYH